MLLDHDVVLEVSRHLVMTASSIAIDAPEQAAIVGIDAVAIPEPAVDELLRVQDSLELLLGERGHVSILGLAPAYGDL